MTFKTPHDSDNPLARLVRHWGIPAELVLIESHLDVAGGGFPTANLSVRIDDSAFRAMGGEPTKKELTVKIDWAEAIGKALEPGAVLLSAEAVRALARYLDRTEDTDDTLNMLVACGGIVSMQSGASAT